MAKGLSKPAIVSAALELLDEVGIDALTVRALATKLGVQAPALYWHVRDKRELLDEMATQVWRGVVDEIERMPEDTPWEDAFRRFAQATRRMLLSHRDGAKVFSGTYLSDAELLRRQEQPLSRMLEAGFTLPVIVRAYTLVYDFTVGFCIEEQAVTQVTASGDDRYSIRARNKRLDDAAHPLAAQAGSEIFGDSDARFATLIDVLVDAVDRMRSAT